MNLSIVVPRYETPVEVVERALNSLVESANFDGFLQEIIVIDSSRIAIPKNRLPTEVRYFHYQRRMFVGEARNCGLEKCVYENIAFFDSDCLRPRGWVEAIMAIDRDIPKWEIITGPVMYESNELSLDLAFHIWEFQEFFSKAPKAVRFAVGCNGVFRSSIFKEIGGYHPHWPNIEDFEYSVRAVSKSEGRRIHYFPDLKIAHQRHLTDRNRLMEKAEMMGYWRGYYDSCLGSESLQGRKFFGVILRAPSFSAFIFVLLNHLTRRGFYSSKVPFLILEIFSICKAWGQGFKRGVQNAVE